MILFNDVIQIFALTDRDANILFSLHVLSVSGIRAALINIAQTRFVVVLDGFL